jgi:hypothetical protein
MPDGKKTVVSDRFYSVRLQDSVSDKNRNTGMRVINPCKSPGEVPTITLGERPRQQATLDQSAAPYQDAGTRTVWVPASRCGR